MSTAHNTQMRTIPGIRLLFAVFLRQQSIQSKQIASEMRHAIVGAMLRCDDET